MPRYIDVKRLCDWLKNLKSGFTKEELVFRDELIEHLQRNNGIVNVLPTADVVEVVRCEDCKHQPNLKTGTKGMMWCRKFRNEVTARDFCSYGERKGGEA